MVIIKKERKIDDIDIYINECKIFNHAPLSTVLHLL